MAEFICYALVGVLYSILCILLVVQRCKLRILQKIRQSNLLVDLDLATTDQLLEELRKRPRPYVLLLPVKEEEGGVFGVNVEVRLLDLMASGSLLKLAASVAEQELAKQGLEIPDLPFGPLTGE